MNRVNHIYRSFLDRKYGAFEINVEFIYVDEQQQYQDESLQSMIKEKENTPNNRLYKMQIDLDKAVADEDYVMAAYIRDQMNKLK